jgi:ATP-binding cassette subfamily B multidrug efflux pump
LGHEKTDELVEKVWELVKIFELSHLAHTKDEVLNLELGENGKKVSGGQAKRIALIRSLISEVDTYLWDDPFSSVDVILEKKILRELKNKGYFKDKNVLLTSHRLTTVQQSHEIYLLDKNGIVEHGEVKELLKSKSKVSEYFEKQSV